MPLPPRKPDIRPARNVHIPAFLRRTKLFARLASPDSPAAFSEAVDAFGELDDQMQTYLMVFLQAQTVLGVGELVAEMRLLRKSTDRLHSTIQDMMAEGDDDGDEDAEPFPDEEPGDVEGDGVEEVEVVDEVVEPVLTGEIVDPPAGERRKVGPEAGQKPPRRSRAKKAEGTS